MRIYEINTWPWLQRLGCRLDAVPALEWDRIAAWGMDAVWLMGVWERSPAGREIARTHEGLQAEYRAALPDFTDADVAGSPYCVRRYRVDEHLGGDAGLAAAREQLARRGMRLILDFVPNHLAPDHPWATEHPEYFVHENGRIAHGRDPYFPPWTDTVQVNAFSDELRDAAGVELRRIATQCDGVRCDMAMLLLNDVFARTWRLDAPPTEYWSDVIGNVRRDFLFLAEAYWDLEWRLLELGFDYCYDKRLYDRLRHEDAAAVRAHLSAPLDYQRRMVRFLENHDEPRAAASFAPERHRAAAVIVFTTPGAKLFYDGQFAGERTRVPVQLGREQRGSEDAGIRSLYERLLAVRWPAEGWQMCPVTGWPDNQSWRNLLAWTAGRNAAIVNFSGVRSQGLVRIDWPERPTWELQDVLTGETYSRGSAEMNVAGLYVDLPPWGAHVFCGETA